ncbi:hypothetical protein WN51_01607 [Melipona quadrifasciata]|uniref:Uncharacterized protein n=1 Tax=Melipona quadrifasciata TaxID=166423 RepID=A0A0N0BE36_9HYME|nr:hypothetical protein WN51_01607 [Melipona quadrifasciata]
MPHNGYTNQTEYSNPSFNITIVKENSLINIPINISLLHLNSTTLGEISRNRDLQNCAKHDLRKKILVKESNLMQEIKLIKELTLRCIENILLFLNTIACTNCIKFLYTVFSTVLTNSRLLSFGIIQRNSAALRTWFDSQRDVTVIESIIDNKKRIKRLGKEASNFDTVDILYLRSNFEQQETLNERKCYALCAAKQGEPPLPAGVNIGNYRSRASTDTATRRCKCKLRIEFIFTHEPKKEKTEQSANGAVSPSGEPQANQGTATTGSLPISAAPPNSGDQQKPNRPNTLEARVVTRRLILFDSEYSRSVESPSERSNLFLRVSLKRRAENFLEHRIYEAAEHCACSVNKTANYHLEIEESVEKGVLDQSSESQQVIERCYPLPPQNTLMLSELPEPPIPLSEIGPIPPPPMFSSSSPTLLLAKQRQIRNPLSSDYEDEEDEEDFDVEEEDNMYVPRMSQPDPAIDTSRVEEIPAKEPKFHAVPLKSVLKKRGSGSGPGTPQNTPTQENRPLTLRQELHASFKLVQRQAISLLTRNPLQTSFAVKDSTVTQRNSPLSPIRSPSAMRIKVKRQPTFHLTKNVVNNRSNVSPGDSSSSRPVRFGLTLPCTLENKENARPYVIREDADGDPGDGQVLYRDEYDDEKSEYSKEQF